MKKKNKNKNKQQSSAFKLIFSYIHAKRTKHVKKQSNPEPKTLNITYKLHIAVTFSILCECINQICDKFFYFFRQLKSIFKNKIIFYLYKKKCIYINKIQTFYNKLKKKWKHNKIKKCVHTWNVNVWIGFFSFKWIIYNYLFN